MFIYCEDKESDSYNAALKRNNLKNTHTDLTDESLISQRQQMKGLWAFLDLSLISTLFGFIAIILGLALCMLNYQDPDKRYRHWA